MPKLQYTKLTPKNRNLSGYTQLWYTSDHLLLLDSTRLSEQYKRFAFSDIQSIVVTELPSRLVLQIVLLLAAVAWMFLWFAVDLKPAKWAFEITGAFALLISIVDIARGRRCRCFLRTRVTGERLQPVSRINIARKFLATVGPMVEAVQGTLSLEMTEAFAARSAPTEPPPPALISSPGYLPEILFAIFLVNAVLIGLAARYPNVSELPGVLINTTLAEVLLIAAALIRQKRDPRVIVLTIVALAIIGVGFDIFGMAREIIGWYITIFDKARTGDKTLTPMRFIPQDKTRLMISLSWRVVAGLGGFAAAFFERRKLAR